MSSLEDISGWCHHPMYYKGGPIKRNGYLGPLSRLSLFWTELEIHNKISLISSPLLTFLLTNCYVSTLIFHNTRENTIDEATI